VIHLDKFCGAVAAGAAAAADMSSAAGTAKTTHCDPRAATATARRRPPSRIPEEPEEFRLFERLV